LTERLLETLGDVVDVVRDAAEQVTPGAAVDVGEGQAVDLVLDIGAQRAHGPLDDTGEQERLSVPEQERHHVQQEREKERAVKRGEVDPVAPATTQETVEEDVGGVTEHPRPGDHETDADERHETDRDHEPPLPRHPARQPSRGGTEILRCHGRHSDRTHPALPHRGSEPRGCVPRGGCLCALCA